MWRKKQAAIYFNRSFDIFSLPDMPNLNLIKNSRRRTATIIKSLFGHLCATERVRDKMYKLLGILSRDWELPIRRF